MKNLKYYAILMVSIFFINNGFAQTKQTVNKSVPTFIKSNGVVAKKGLMTEEEVRNWPHMDIIKDSVPGMSLQKAYDFLADKKGEKVIVAIIDSGIDINHEDLKNMIWVNTKEIPNNRKDDDKNGYVDDINGWNFLGSKRGNAYAEQLEMTRMVKKLTPKFDGKLPSQIASKDLTEYALFVKLSNEIKGRKAKAYESKMQYENYYNSIQETHIKVSSLLKKENYTLAELDSLGTAHEDMQADLYILMRIVDTDGSVAVAFKYLEEGISYFDKQYTSPNYDISFDGRAIVGDNPNDFNDRNYGNSSVLPVAEDEMHGTHVTGIVAAKRNNSIGMNGVTNNVKIMAIRAVPDGDEYDKDIALAIRYAVDNGAKVINMSFGKSYSPQKEWVYDAIKYAASKDVLLVHAAGNDSKNSDKAANYPNDSDDKITEFADNVITIGAMTRQFNENLVADFSNYGKKNVDLFAPGLEIYSTTPNNNYKSIQGTSMASPQVAGVAALVRSYYPTLSAKEVKQILMNSGIEVSFNVILPDAKAKVSFSSLSVSGKVLNAYNAVLMAQQQSK